MPTERIGGVGGREDARRPRHGCRGIRIRTAVLRRSSIRSPAGPPAEPTAPASSGGGINHARIAADVTGSSSPQSKGGG